MTSKSVTMLGKAPKEPWWRGFVTNRAVQFAAAFWLVGTLAAVVLTGESGVPFGDRTGSSVGAELFTVWDGLVVALLLVAVAYGVTRQRSVPDLAAIAPERSVARFELMMLVGYGVLVQLGGWLLGSALSEQPISLHLHGPSTVRRTRSRPATRSSGQVTTLRSTRSSRTSSFSGAATATNS